ncbi:Acetyl-CoA carboxylase, partial [Ophiophagus hannah]
MSNKPPPDEKLLELNLHSHFIIGSVSEDNSEDETSSLVKIDLLEEKDQSISPFLWCSRGPSHEVEPNETPYFK